MKLYRKMISTILVFALVISVFQGTNFIVSAAGAQMESYFNDFDNQTTRDSDFTLYGTNLPQETDQNFVLGTDIERSVVKLNANNGNVNGTGWSQRWLVLKNRIYRDFEVEMVFKRTDNTLSSGQMWLQMRKTTADATFNAAGAGLSVLIDKSGKLTMFINQTQIIAGYAASPAIPYTDTAYHTLKVRVVGNVINIYLNNQLFYQYTDTQNRTTEGIIAIFGNKITNGAVDSLKVTPIVNFDNMAVLEGVGKSKVMKLNVGERLFPDRTFYVKDTLPDVLKGKSFLFDSIDTGATATVKTAGNIYIITPDVGVSNSQARNMINNGYTKLSYESFKLSKSLAENSVIYSKYVEAGETIHYGKWNVIIGAVMPEEDYYTSPAMIPSQVMLLPGGEYLPKGRQWQGCPSVEKTASGRLWATWFTGGPNEGSAECYSVVVYSDDNGVTWKDPVLAIDHENNTVKSEDSQFWVDPLGRLWIFWAQTNTFEEYSSVLGGWTYFDGIVGVWAIRIDNPDAPAEQLTWTEPVRICNGLMRNRPTVLSTGEWLLTSYDFVDMDYTPVYVSVNQGATWSLQGKAYCKMSNVFDEAMIVEKNDGRLWMMIRTADGISESFSTDKGRTWTDAVDATQPELGGPNSRFYIRRLSSGNLLLINHYNFTGRSNIYAMISEDDGATWPYKLCLDERDNISYPDAVEDANGLIYAVHDRLRNSEGEIYLSNFTEQDVKDGAFNSPNARQKYLISQVLKYPTVSQQSYLFDGETDVAVNVTLGDSTFTGLEGNGIQANDYSFSNGVITISKIFLNSLSTENHAFSLITSLDTVSFDIVRAQTDTQDYFNNFDNSISDFTEVADSTATGTVFSLAEDEGRTVLKSSAQGTGWPKHTAYLNSNLYKNFTLEATFKRSNTASGFPLVFLGKTNLAVNHEQVGGGLAVAFQADGKLTVYANGTLVIERPIPSGIYTDNAYNKVKIVAYQNRFEIYLNDVYLETYVDSKGGTNLSGGYVGIATSNSIAYFDDFRVTANKDIESIGPNASTAVYDFNSIDVMQNFNAYYEASSTVNPIKEDYSSHWSLSNGYIERINDVSGDSTDKNASLILKNIGLKNFEMSVDYQRGSTGWAWASMVAKQSYAGKSFLSNGFGAFAQGRGQATLWGGSLTGTSPSEGSAISGYNDTSWHNIKIKVVNKSVWVYIDGKQYLSVTAVSDNFLIPGYMGLQSVNNNCKYDNLVVTKLDDSGNPQSLFATGADDGRIKIACIGDSITYGAGASVPSLNYPAQLQSLLGNGYNVVNYGVSASTLLKKGNYPYWNLFAYQQSHEGTAPDVVIIMLGTNDTKSVNWVYKDEYIQDYVDLINSYKALSPNTKVLVATSPTCYITDGSGITDLVSSEVVPLQRQIALQTGCDVIDINSQTKNMPGNFVDGVHPNDAGYSVIATAMYRYLSPRLLTELNISNGLTQIESGTTVGQLLSRFTNYVANLRILNHIGNEITDTAIKAGTGMSVQLYADGNVTDSVTMVVKGDIDGSGTLSVVDLLSVKDAAVNGIPASYTAAQTLAADYNGQDGINVFDAIAMKNKLLGK